MKILNKHFGSIIALIIVIILTYAGLTAYNNSLQTGKSLLEEFGNSIKGMFNFGSLGNIFSGGLGSIMNVLRNFFTTVKNVIVFPFNLGMTAGNNILGYFQNSPTSNSGTNDTSNGGAGSVTLGFGVSDLKKAADNTSTWINDALVNAAQILHPSLQLQAPPVDTTITSAVQDDNTLPQDQRWQTPGFVAYHSTLP